MTVLTASSTWHGYLSHEAASTSWSWWFTVIEDISVQIIYVISHHYCM